MTTNLLWTEKYRPQHIKDYVFRDSKQKKQVETWIKEKTIPHLLFSGSAGIGKTTLAKVILNELGVLVFSQAFAEPDGNKVVRLGNFDLYIHC